jgi:hypothetical protein
MTREQARRTAFTLSVIIAGLMVAASLAGLLIDGLYRDNPFVAAGWRGNDLVTLVIAVPLLIGSLTLARRGSDRARLVWVGVLYYTLYNYAFYLFGAAFNPLFLAYVALFALPIFALIFGLVGMDVEALRRGFGPRTPVRAVAVAMCLLGGALGAFWIAMSAPGPLTAQTLDLIARYDAATNLIAALDLTFIVPAFVLGGVWLWMQRPWGYVLAGMITVSGAVYMAVLAASALSQARAGLASAADALPWAALSAVCSALAVALLVHLRGGESAAST